jgi:hypothetical protein
LFSERLETLEIVEATTLKADGRRLPVDLTKVVTQLQPGVANMPIYGDLKGMVVIYPEVGAGAGISLTWRRHVHHPLCEIGQRLNDEWLNIVRGRFQDADTKKDGKLTVQELDRPTGQF